MAAAAGCRQPLGLGAIKVKAHLTDEERLAGICLSRRLEQGNACVDAATARAVKEHPAELRLFVEVMADRGRVYRRFLQRYRDFLVAVAMDLHGRLQEVLQQQLLLPPTVFGRKVLSRRVPVTLTLARAESEPHTP